MLSAQPLGARRARRSRARSSCSRVGRSASRLTSAQPRYCVLASSSRSAPSDSASAMISGTRSRLLAVEHHVERERQAELLAPSGPPPACARRTSQPGDAVRRRRARRPAPTAARCRGRRRSSRSSRSRVQRDAAGDQVGVELAARAPPRPAPRDRRARSGSPPVRLTCTHAERLRLARSTRSQSAVSSASRVARAVERVRAVAAAQRAAVGQLGDQRVGPRRSSVIASLRMQPALGQRAAGTPAPRARPPRAAARAYLRGQLLDDRGDRVLARAQLRRCRPRGRVQHEAALRDRAACARRARDRSAAATLAASARSRQSARDHARAPPGPQPGST